MLRALLPLLSATTIEGATYSKCADRDVQIVFLQDGSQSFANLISLMSEKARDLISGITNGIESPVSFGLTAFVDKPIPFRGVGGGRGIKNELDYCYKRVSPLEVNNDLTNGYNVLKGTQGAGGDTPENPYEAILYAIQDPSLNWKRDKAIKFLVIVTDDLPHVSGDGQQGVDWWNKGQPAFWDKKFIDSASYYPVDAPAIYPAANVKTQYARAIELHKKGTLTAEEQLELNGLLEVVGPAVFPQLKEHQGDFENYLNCDQWEYPTVGLLAEKLQSSEVVPLFLLAPPPLISTESREVCSKKGHPIDDSGDETRAREDFMACMQAVYTDDLNAMQLKNSGVMHFTNTDAEEFMSAVKRIVDQTMSQIECKDDIHYIPGDCKDNKGTYTGIAIGCAAGGAALVAAIYLCLRPGCWKAKPEENTEYDAYAQVQRIYSAQERDQTQILKVEDFA